MGNLISAQTKGAVWSILANDLNTNRFINSFLFEKLLSGVGILVKHVSKRGQGGVDRVLQMLFASLQTGFGKEKKQIEN